MRRAGQVSLTRTVPDGMSVTAHAAMSAVMADERADQSHFCMSRSVLGRTDGWERLRRQCPRQLVMSPKLPSAFWMNVPFEPPSKTASRQKNLNVLGPFGK